MSLDRDRQSGFSLAAEFQSPGPARESRRRAPAIDAQPPDRARHEKFLAENETVGAGPLNWRVGPLPVSFFGTLLGVGLAVVMHEKRPLNGLLTLAVMAGVIFVMLDTLAPVILLGPKGILRRSLRWWRSFIRWPEMDEIVLTYNPASRLHQIECFSKQPGLVFPTRWVRMAWSEQRHGFWSTAHFLFTMAARHNIRVRYSWTYGARKLEPLYESVYRLERNTGPPLRPVCRVQLVVRGVVRNLEGVSRFLRS